MINKPVWIWKGIPENFSEFREVFILWLGSALFVGVLIAIIINYIVMVV